MQQILKNTVNNAAFSSVPMDASVKFAMRDVEDPNYFKAMYVLCRAVFPALKLLRHCDANRPAMDKIYFLAHRTTVAIQIQRSVNALNDDDLFGKWEEADVDLSSQEKIVYFEEGNVTDVEESTNNDVEEDSDEDSSSGDDDDNLGDKCLKLWEHRVHRLEHDFAVCAWSLSVMPEVREDVVQRLDGPRRLMVEDVVRRLHVFPCPNPGKTTEGKLVADLDPDTIVDIFWDEFLAFQKKNKPFDNEGRWNSTNAIKGDSFLWHEKYSLPYTAVLGFVACRVCSKVCGIGAAERAWGDVKHLKTGKRKSMSGERTEKRSVIYTSARIHDARLKRQAMENITYQGPNTMFGDDDLT